MSEHGIAAAPEDIRALIAEVRRLRQGVEVYRLALDSFEDEQDAFEDERDVLQAMIDAARELAQTYAKAPSVGPLDYDFADGVMHERRTIGMELLKALGEQ